MAWPCSNPLIFSDVQPGEVIAKTMRTVSEHSEELSSTLPVLSELDGGLLRFVTEAAAASSKAETETISTAEWVKRMEKAQVKKAEEQELSRFNPPAPKFRRVSSFGTRCFG
eukprot:TRINITY_DN2615_c0_g1_i2.p1 TRINITY_DN2615_c0_g1~~TRINITY_DN2615_c0_g1_i2.p1  ORF type:complete len:126 (+),score=10.26 TRINITY_DN2615_c0_g1_i2:43-378(+)